MVFNELFDGKYRIVRLLGTGGCGQVYLAENVNLRGYFAIKEIPVDEESRPLVEREVELLKRLKHHALPRVFDVIRESDAIFIVEDYIEGETADKHIASRGAIPEETAVRWGVEICDIMSYLHGQRPEPIIYRDLKPANIIISEDGAIHLVDFGSARRYKIGQDSDTVYIGTRGYAAPEQYGFGQTSVRTDIYSFGMTMAHIVTGAKPMQSGHGAVLGEGFGVLREGDAAPVGGGSGGSGGGGGGGGSGSDGGDNALREGETEEKPRARISEGLAHIVRRCAQPIADMRYGSFDEVRDDLVALGGNGHIQYTSVLDVASDRRYATALAALAAEEPACLDPAAIQGQPSSMAGRAAAERESGESGAAFAARQPSTASAANGAPRSAPAPRSAAAPPAAPAANGAPPSLPAASVIPPAASSTAWAMQQARLSSIGAAATQAATAAGGTDASAIGAAGGTDASAIGAASGTDASAIGAASGGAGHAQAASVGAGHAQAAVPAACAPAACAPGASAYLLAGRCAMLSVAGSGEFACELAYHAASRHRFNTLVIDLDFERQSAAWHLRASPSLQARHEPYSESPLRRAVDAVGIGYSNANNGILSLGAPHFASRGDKWPDGLFLLYNDDTRAAKGLTDALTRDKGRFLCRFLLEMTAQMDICVMLAGSSLFSELAAQCFQLSHSVMYTACPDMPSVIAFNAFADLAEYVAGVPSSRVQFVAWGYDDRAAPSDGSAMESIGARRVLGGVRGSRRRAAAKAACARQPNGVDSGAPCAARMGRGAQKDYDEILYALGVCRRGR